MCHEGQVSGARKVTVDDDVDNAISAKAMQYVPFGRECCVLILGLRVGQRLCTTILSESLCFWNVPLSPVPHPALS